MHNWRVLVKVADGRQFSTRIEKLTSACVVLHGEHTLPAGMACDLQIIIPPTDKNHAPSVADLQGVVDTVVFTAKSIRLVFRVKSFSEGARQLIDAWKAGT